MFRQAGQRPGAAHIARVLSFVSWELLRTFPRIAPSHWPPDVSEDAQASAFAELGLDPRITATLATLGYEEPTPIQRAAIPVLLEGRDVLGQAATGTGKTAAFTLPLIQRAALGAGVTGGVVEGAATDDGADDAAMDFERQGPAVLILVPTRELAMQVGEAVHKYGKGLGMRAVPVYGGQDIRRQLRALERGADVVIATPGRALDHIRRGTLALGSVRAVVLDEADEMLDMGFAEDLEAILVEAPASRQTALFSATLPPRIRDLAERHLNDPVRVSIPGDRGTAGTIPRVRQTGYIVARAHKVAALGRVLDVESPALAFVFCRTRTEVDELTETLTGRGYRAEALHGGMSQEQRDRVMRRVRSGATDLLVATDVAARGLDVEHVSHVVNYDVPSAPEAYIHRIGRTGRAGREGVAITLVEPREHRLLRNIEHITKQKIDIATVPTVADLRARRLELTRASLEEALLEGEDALETYRVVVNALAAEYDVVDIAAAAVKLADEGRNGDGEPEQEIPAVQLRERSREGREGREGRGSRFERPPRDAREGRDDRPDREVRGDREDRGPRGRRGGRSPSAEWDVTRVYVGAGRKAGIRPGDLVGAIANEANVSSSAIGAIEIADRFSLVEVPEQMADDIIEALRGTTIKGKRVTVRRDRDFEARGRD
ncbi:MAG: DEAD-box ATP-dependent helicase CshA [Geminicoccaceae bacterium]|nr:DEAD-box ATP-dependent helicase CshA [Geminicoccaceae bacterium]